MILRGTLIGGSTVHAMARNDEAAYLALDSGLVVLQGEQTSLICDWEDSEEACRSLAVLPWLRKGVENEHLTAL